MAMTGMTRLTKRLADGRYSLIDGHWEDDEDYLRALRRSIDKLGEYEDRHEGYLAGDYAPLPLIDGTR